ncbi:MAG: cytochrome c-type biogenesis protein [Gemmatimonadota bacterium]
MSRFCRYLLVLAMLAGVGAGPLAGQNGEGQTRERQMEGLVPQGAGGPLEDPVQEARATRLADELRCPVCQGLSINDSPSPLAQDMKNLIRAQVAAGASDEDVHEYFMSKYGEWVLLEPKAQGFNLLVYLLPALGLVAGGALIVVAVRRWTVPEEEVVSSS